MPINANVTQITTFISICCFRNINDIIGISTTEILIKKPAFEAEVYFRPKVMAINTLNKVSPKINANITVRIFAFTMRLLNTIPDKKNAIKNRIAIKL